MSGVILSFTAVGIVAVNHYNQEGRQNALDILQRSAGYPELQAERHKLMDRYGITDNEVDVEQLWRNWGVEDAD